MSLVLRIETIDGKGPYAFDLRLFPHRGWDPNRHVDPCEEFPKDWRGKKRHIWLPIS